MAPSRTPKSEYDPIPVKGDVSLTTPRAFKFTADGRDHYHWFPKSQCDWVPSKRTMWMPRWMAKDKGFVE